MLQQTRVTTVIDYYNRWMEKWPSLHHLSLASLERSARCWTEVVLDKSKNVLVEFYAPWCGHCKSLAPTYEKVATSFKSKEEVVLANVDADTHKDLAEKYGISGFPTLKFFPKNNKDGEDYEGGRDVDAFVNFLNDKCGTSRDAKGHPHLFGQQQCIRKTVLQAGIVETLDTFHWCCGSSGNNSAHPPIGVVGLDWKISLD